MCVARDPETHSCVSQAVTHGGGRKKNPITRPTLISFSKSFAMSPASPKFLTKSGALAPNVTHRRPSDPLITKQSATNLPRFADYNSTTSPNRRFVDLRDVPRSARRACAMLCQAAAKQVCFSYVDMFVSGMTSDRPHRCITRHRTRLHCGAPGTVKEALATPPPPPRLETICAFAGAAAPKDLLISASRGQVVELTILLAMAAQTAMFHGFL